MTRNLQRLTAVIAIAFMITALTVAFWNLVRSPALLARDDNPRLVEAELGIRRGGVLDRNGVPLALSVADEGVQVRSYPDVEAAGVIGYYSLRYGVGGIEAAYDDVLRGDAFATGRSDALTSRLLHRAQQGGDVRLTIDLAVQQQAEQAFSSRNGRGALVMVGVPSGEIVAMVSSPTFDPNLLDDTWDSLSEDADGPLLNRVTQGLYQPGAALQSVLLGASLNAGEVDLQQEIGAGELATTLGPDGIVLDCASPPREAVTTLSDAFRWGCPAPFQMLGSASGRQRLDGVLQDFGLTEDVPLGLPPELMADVQPPESQALRELVLGQGDLQVTPLHMAFVAAAIANHGEMPAPKVVDAIRPPDGSWELVSAEGHSRAAIAPDSADLLAQVMRQAVASGAANPAARSGVLIGGHSALALADDEGTLNAWFVGFARGAAGDDEALAIAVLIEDVRDANDAARIGGLVLAQALDIMS